MTQPFGFIRKLHGVSLQKIADYAGVSVGFLHEVENCKREVTEGLKNKIYEALKVAVFESLDERKLFYENKKCELIHV